MSHSIATNDTANALPTRTRGRRNGGTDCFAGVVQIHGDAPGRSRSDSLEGAPTPLNHPPLGRALFF